jgi:hypothetical protein
VRGAIGEGALLHALVIGLATVLEIGRRGDHRLDDALSGFEARYLFRAGASARQLLIRGERRVCSRAGIGEAPDFEISFLDLHGALVGLRNGPQDVFQLLLENKIDQRGNKHYLFRLGYLLGLCKEALCHDRTDLVSGAFDRARSWVRQAARA